MQLHLPKFLRGTFAEFFAIKRSKAPPVWTFRGGMAIEAMLLFILCFRALVNNGFWSPQSPGMTVVWPTAVLVVNVSVGALGSYILLYVLDFKIFKRYLIVTRLFHLSLEIFYGLSWSHYKVAAAQYVERTRQRKALGRAGHVGAEPTPLPPPGWTDPSSGVEFALCFPGLVHPFRRRGNLDPVRPPQTDPAPAGTGGGTLARIARNTLDRLVVLALGM